MEQKTLSRWLKCIIVGVGICGLMVFAAVVPMYAVSMRTMHPEFTNRFWSWLIFLWISGLPCFAALAMAWRIAANIGADRSFSVQNAGIFRQISWLAVGDACFFFAGNVLLLLLNMSHPSVVIASSGIAFAGVAVAVVSAVLSHLVKKAAALQEQSDLTI